MSRSPALDIGSAETWFLARGLPAVVPRSALLHRLWTRSAPALTALAVIAANSIVTVALSGSHTVDIAGRPNLPEGVVLALLILVLPAAALAGWLVSRMDSPTRRAAASGVAIAVIALGAVFGGPSRRIGVNLITAGASVGVVLLITATGFGSIIGWAVSLMVSNLAAIGAMFVRALPVVLLTFLVFFNTHVWLMTSLISRDRLWLGMGFLFAIAASFLVSTTLEQVRPLLESDNPVPEEARRLRGTPFEDVPDPGRADALSFRERANAVFVVAFSQLVHVVTVAVMTGMVFLVLGLILISPEVLNAWTRGAGRTDGEFAGMILPVPDSLIQTTMLLSAITVMYLAAKAATDKEYRSQFIDPMLQDLQRNLIARARYRAARDEEAA